MPTLPKTHRQPLLGHDEKSAGSVADHIVYYRTQSGKLYWQPVWNTNLRKGQTPAQFLHAVIGRSLKSIVTSLPRDPGAEFMMPC